MKPTLLWISHICVWYARTLIFVQCSLLLTCSGMRQARKSFVQGKRVIFVSIYFINAFWFLSKSDTLKYIFDSFLSILLHQYSKVNRLKKEKYFRDNRHCNGRAPFRIPIWCTHTCIMLNINLPTHIYCLLIYFLQCICFTTWFFV